MWTVHARAFLKQKPPRRPPRSKRMSIPWRRSCQHFGSAEASRGKLRCETDLACCGWCCFSAPKKTPLPRDKHHHRQDFDFRCRQTATVGSGCTQYSSGLQNRPIRPTLLVGTDNRQETCPPGPVPRGRRNSSSQRSSNSSQGQDKGLVSVLEKRNNDSGCQVLQRPLAPAARHGGADVAGDKLPRAEPPVKWGRLLRTTDETVSDVSGKRDERLHKRLTWHSWKSTHQCLRLCFRDGGSSRGKDPSSLGRYQRRHVEGWRELLGPAGPLFRVNQSYPRWQE
jgi:hypothetical protein